MKRLIEPLNLKESKEKQQETGISLGSYLSMVENVVNKNFNIPSLVSCEIISISEKGGHYYLELSDIHDNGYSGKKKIKAPTAIIYKDNAFNLLFKFQKSTGMHLANGMRVLFRMTAKYSVAFSMSLVITDIEPSFTMGEIEAKKNIIINSMRDKGLSELNKQKHLPKIFKNVAVISPSGAAGLGDFKVEADKLEKYNVCKFHYFGALFEGQHVEKSVVSAFVKIHEIGFEKFDCVVFIRGGGAKNSLEQLDEIKIIASVCRCPIPVIAGIGHERDKVLIDQFAKLSIDTPSKVIEYIKNSILMEYNKAKTSKIHIDNLIKNNIISRINYNIAVNDYIKKQILNFIENKIIFSKTLIESINTHKKNVIFNLNASLIKNLEDIKRLSIQKINDNINLAKNNNESINTILINSVKNLIKDNENIFKIIQEINPEKLLKNGFSIVSQNGETISKISDLNENIPLKIILSDGEIEIFFKLKK